jgi:acyl carrier protein
MVVTPEQPLVLRDQYPLPTPYLAPRTATEQRLEEIWRIVLSMDRVGIRDNYNDLGGDSLMATTIFAEIRARFGVSVPLASFIETPTIEALASRIDVPSADRIG